MGYCRLFMAVNGGYEVSLGGLISLEGSVLDFLIGDFLKGLFM